MHHFTEQVAIFPDVFWILKVKQVDILISKNQALQILYLKHGVYNNETT